MVVVLIINKLALKLLYLVSIQPTIISNLPGVQMKSSVREIKIKLPENVLLSASISEKQLVQEMREVIALKLFAEGRLSGGTAAKMAGMSRVKFLLKAGQQNIEWLPYSKDEVRRELS